MLKKLIIFLVIYISLYSCSFFKSNSKDDKKAIAKVNDTYLYLEDLKAVLPKDYKKMDSALLASNYINNWAKQQLLLAKAQINLNDDQVEIDKLVIKYRQDLLINKYREAVVSQNLDTVVNETDVDNFYTNNKDILKLNEELVKLKFIQVNKDISDKEKIISLFKSRNKEDAKQVISKELEFKTFYFNDSVWIKYKDVLNILPILNDADFKSIKKNSFLQKEDSLNLYLIYINDKIGRNSISPKGYVVPTIKQMILHARKLELLKKLEQTLLNDANKNGQYEIYK